jgi:hypothetical protein
MNKPMAVAVLVAGIVLLVFGYNAEHSASSAFSHFFTGSPNNKAILMIVVGTVAIVVGLIGLGGRGTK